MRLLPPLRSGCSGLFFNNLSEGGECHIREPYPERAETYEEDYTQSKRGCTSSHIGIVLVGDDDTRECRRKGCRDNKHLQVEGVHLEEQTESEHHQRHHDHFHD